MKQLSLIALLSSTLMLGGVAHAAEQVNAAAASALGSVLGSTVGRQMGEDTGALVGSTVGAAAGGAAAVNRDNREKTAIGAALGSAAGHTVGRQMSGSQGATIGGAIGAAGGAALGQKSAQDRAEERERERIEALQRQRASSRIYASSYAGQRATLNTQNRYRSSDWRKVNWERRAEGKGDRGRHLGWYKNGKAHSKHKHHH